MQLQFKRVRTNTDLSLPKYQTAGSAGFDFCADVAETLQLAPGQRSLIPTGFAVALEVGYELQIRPRSGLALKNGVTCLNSPGTIDSDYRGEIGVILINHGAEVFEIKRGDRIAQGVVAKCEQPTLIEVQELDTTDRGAGGFGSTGK